MSSPGRYMPLPSNSSDNRVSPKHINDALRPRTRSSRQSALPPEQSTAGGSGVLPATCQDQDSAPVCPPHQRDGWEQLLSLRTRAWACCCLLGREEERRIGGEFLQMRPQDNRASLVFVDKGSNSHGDGRRRRCRRDTFVGNVGVNEAAESVGERGAVAVDETLG